MQWGTSISHFAHTLQNTASHCKHSEKTDFFVCPDRFLLWWIISVKHLRRVCCWASWYVHNVIGNVSVPIHAILQCVTYHYLLPGYLVHTNYDVLRREPNSKMTRTGKNALPFVSFFFSRQDKRYSCPCSSPIWFVSQHIIINMSIPTHHNMV